MNATIPSSPLDALARLGEPAGAGDNWRVTPSPEPGAEEVGSEEGSESEPEAAAGEAGETATGERAGRPGEAEAGARDGAGSIAGVVPAAVVTRRPSRWPTAFLAVVAVLGLAGTGFFARAWADQRSSASSSPTTAVRAAADGFVTALTNFDPGNVATDFGKIQDYATGSFATQAKQFFSTSIRSQLEAAGATSRGQVQDLFIESLSGGQATVFAVVDQTYANDKMSSPASDTLRLELGMTQLASGWKVAAVTVVQSPAGFPTAGAPTPTTPPKG
jgi:hypothetical protein